MFQFQIKSGDRVLANNYRPISLTSVVAKILERLIHHRSLFLVKTKLNLLCDNQHGFRRFRSCLTQSCKLVHQWLSTLDKFGAVDIVFLDFAKAFDKVSHPHLLQRLQSYGIISILGPTHIFNLCKGKTYHGGDKAIVWVQVPNSGRDSLQSPCQTITGVYCILLYCVEPLLD